jgi:pimeloyl-ACP methyl ester carboxylesterase
MCYAARHPGTLAGAVFIDIDPSPPDYQVQHLNDQGARPARRYASFDETVAREARVAPAAAAAIHRHLASHGYREAGGGWEQKHDQAFLRAVRRWDLLDELQHVTVPALVIRGGESNVMAPDSPARMLERLPAGSAVIIPGAGHQVHLERPREVAAAIAKFVEGLSPRPRR